MKKTTRILKKTSRLVKPGKAPIKIERTAETVAVDYETRHSTDAFTLYIRQIGETPLLTPQEEVVLAKRIKRGDKAAREHMIKANLRFVVKIARDYENYGLPLLDLINEGNIGLMKAVDRFDPTKGAKLSTYASWWIKQSIRRAISDQSKTIRLPVHVEDKLMHIRRAETRLQEEFGRMPTDEELSDELGMTAKRIKQYRQASARPTSLDAPIGDSDSDTIAEVVADEKAESPYNQLEDKTTTELLHELMSSLDGREQEILRQRFGLGREDEKTLEEIGQQFGVTRERIRQLEEIALTKLRRKMNKIETGSFVE